MAKHILIPPFITIIETVRFVLPSACKVAAAVFGNPMAAEANRGSVVLFFKKNLNASKPSEHPPHVEEECLKV